MAPASTRHRSVGASLLLTAVMAAFLVGVPSGTVASAAPAAPSPACPAAPGAARYVRFVYLEILERCPDAAGAAYWTSRLDGGVSRWTVAEALDASTENLGRNNVDPLYQRLLERPPTAAERSAGITKLRAERENAPLTADLLASNEGYALHTTASTPRERDREWLTWAYARVLDRATDPQGEAHYLAGFAPTGSTPDQRRRVAMQLERSNSNARSWVLATMAEALGRPADPAGAAYWQRWLTTEGRWQTFRLWTRQLASDEAARRAQTQP